MTRSLPNRTRLTFLVATVLAAVVVCTPFFSVPVASAATIGFRSAASAAGGTNSSLTITKPTGTVSGDVLVAAIAIRPETLTITPPSGWSLVLSQANTNTQANAVAVYTKVAGASEPTSYTWSFSAGSTGSSGGIAAFTGVDSVTPVNVSGGATTGVSASVSVNAPSVTTTVANTMLVTVHADSNANTWAPPSGMTEAFDTSSVTPINDVGESVELNYLAQSSIGSTGVKTATVEQTSGSPTPDVGEGIALALTPSGVVDPSDFTSSGTWTAPAGVTQVEVEAWGAAVQEVARLVIRQPAAAALAVPMRASS